MNFALSAFKKRGWIWILIALFLFSLPLFMNEMYLKILFNIAVWAIITLGFDMLLTKCGLLSLGHSFFYASGAYFSAYAQLFNFHLIPSILIAGLGTALIALPLGLITLKLRGFYFAMATLGLAEIAHLSIRALVLFGGDVGLWLSSVYSIETLYIVAMVALCVTLFICYIIENSKFGLKIKTISMDEGAAKTIGLNTARYKLYTFLFSTFLAGIGGGLAVSEHTVLLPSAFLSSSVSFKMIMATVIGGMGAIPGQLIGAAFVISTEAIFAMYITDVKFIIFGLILIVVILFFPAGIYGGIYRFWLSYSLRKRKKA